MGFKLIDHSIVWLVVAIPQRTSCVHCSLTLRLYLERYDTGSFNGRRMTIYPSNTRPLIMQFQRPLPFLIVGNEPAILWISFFRQIPITVTECNHFRRLSNCRLLLKAVIGITPKTTQANFGYVSLGSPAIVAITHVVLAGAQQPEFILLIAVLLRQSAAKRCDPLVFWWC